MDLISGGSLRKGERGRPLEDEKARQRAHVKVPELVDAQKRGTYFKRSAWNKRGPLRMTRLFLSSVVDIGCWNGMVLMEIVKSGLVQKTNMC